MKLAWFLVVEVMGATKEAWSVAKREQVVDGMSVRILIDHKFTSSDERRGSFFFIIIFFFLLLALSLWVLTVGSSSTSSPNFSTILQFPSMAKTPA